MDRTPTVWTLVFLALWLVGCAHNPAQLRPGAVNVFDQNTHDALRTTQAVLEQAAKDVAPLPAGSTIKTAYNAAVVAYNSAEEGYQAYHKALIAGQTANQSTVQALMQGLAVAVTNYQAARSKPPGATLWRGRVAYGV